MISIESALKIIKKHGYNSKTVHPFIYKNNNEIGINYSYIDNKYGITERVVSFHNDIDLDLFLKRYQWYKLNGKKYNVYLKLNNYEVPNPEVLYIRNNHVMTDNEMFNIELHDKREKSNLKLSATKRYLIVAEELMDHYYQEKEIKEKYVKNLFNKEKELQRYYLDLQNLVDIYNVNNTHPSIEEENKVFKTNLELESDINSKISEYKKKLPKEDVLKELINEAWGLNKSLELNNSYMYALRYNDDIDEEMRLVVTKIDFMKELLSKKRFKIINLKKKFDSIDNQSTYECIYDDNFEAKYKEFINNKYNQKENINEFRLCEYLNNFKSNKEYDIERNVLRCKKEITEKIEDYNTSTEDVNNSLTKQFNTNLNDEERNALILYNSFYRELFDMIQGINDFEKLPANEIINLLNITNNFLPLYEECYTKVKKLLELEDNKDIKNTIFKDIFFTSKEEFIKSIINTIKTIININNKMVLKYNYKLYFSTNDFDSLGNDNFIHTSSIIAPYLINKSNNYRVITANVKKGINVLFSPKFIAKPIDSAKDKTIKIVNNESPEIIIDTRDIIINKDKNTVIYSRFKTNEIKTKDYTYIDKFDLDYKININKVTIEKRNINE